MKKPHLMAISRAENYKPGEVQGLSALSLAEALPTTRRARSRGDLQVGWSGSTAVCTPPSPRPQQLPRRLSDGLRARRREMRFLTT